ncbi:hypothetical protein EXIGLDRAFT_137339 [Exidia glandulosa HHB12029]|uniref:F-box domain-containing protein n=1 Tax=Exidia glandulosa HHB12029 TaxID=1314781 RepID=A0A165G0F0_EXIGL|nr:hypothetical protein EXIGLDRAFT_137339 [Exidia glandulosa HHB12029]
MDLVVVSDDLLLHIFDHLFLSELIRASAVCRRWRDLATSHVLFWKSISLRGDAKNAVKAFVARLDKTYGRPSLVEIDLCSWPPVDLPNDSEISAALSRHLRHIGGLVIRHITRDPHSIFRMLQRPAPLLQRLELVVGPGSDAIGYTYPALPYDLFWGQLRAITTLQLAGIRLPVRTPMWFGRLTEFHLTLLSHDVYDLPWLPTIMPCLVRLQLGGNVKLPEPSSSDDAFWNQLESFQLLVGRVCEGWQPWNAYLADVRRVEISSPDDRVVELYSRHLKGPLDLVVREHDGHDLFFVTVSSSSSRLVRVFAEHRVSDHLSSVLGRRTTWSADAPPPHRVFEYQSIVERIVTLSLDGALWNDFVGYFAVLPSLQELHIVGGLYEFVFDISTLRRDRCLRCPVLRVLSLQNLAPSAEASVVADFVAHGLERQPGPLTLRTSSVLQGSFDVFGEGVSVSVDGILVRDAGREPTGVLAESAA